MMDAIPLKRTRNARKDSERADLSRISSHPKFDPCLNLAEACLYLGNWDATELRRRVALKEIAAIRKPTEKGQGHFYFRLSELNRYLKACPRSGRGGSQPC